MEHAIGTRITLSDGRRVEVVESTKSKRYSTCYKCVWFTSYPICPAVSLGWKCSKLARTDHKGIIYKEVQEGISMKTIEELLNSLPDKIVVPNDNPEDEFDHFRFYGFVLDKDNGVYELSYFNFLYEEEIVSFNGSLHEVARNMYEWCKEKGYLND